MKFAATVGALLLTLVFATAAPAQDPTTDVYGGDLPTQTPQAPPAAPPEAAPPEAAPPGDDGGVLPEEDTQAPQDEEEPSGAAPSGDDDTPTAAPETQTVDTPAGSLPFTGLEVGLILLIGAALIATGVALRRLGVRQS